MGTVTRWRQILSVLMLPGMILVVVPALILHARAGPPHVLWPLRIGLVLAGTSLVVVGLALLVQTVRLFFDVGRGTLAPWDPP